MVSCFSLMHVLLKGRDGSEMIVVGHRLEIIIDHQLESVAAVDVIF